MLDGNGSGPTRGMVILGRLLTPADGAQHRCPGAGGPDACCRADVRRGSRPSWSRPTRSRSVYRAFGDIYGQPIMTLRVDVPREITARGRTAVAYASSCLVGGRGHRARPAGHGAEPRDPAARSAVVTRHAVALGEDKDLTTRLDLAAPRRDRRAGARVRPHGGRASPQSRTAAGRSVLPGRLRRARQGRAAQSRQRHDADRRAAGAASRERLRAAPAEDAAAGGRRAAGGACRTRSAARISRNSCAWPARSWRSRCASRAGGRGRHDPPGERRAERRSPSRCAPRATSTSSSRCG